MKRTAFVLSLVAGLAGVLHYFGKTVDTTTVALVFPVTVNAFTEFEHEFESEIANSGISSRSFSAEGSPERFGTVIKSALVNSPQVLVTVGSQLTNLALGNQFGEDLPTVVSSCISAPEKVEALTAVGLDPPRTRPVGIISDSPKANIYALAADSIIQVLGPAPKKVGVIYNESELNSKNTATMITEPLAEKGCTIVPAQVNAPTDLESACKSLLIQGVDIIVIPHDKIAVSQASTIVKLASEVAGKKPLVFALDDGTVKKSGAHMGVSVSYGELGRMTARLCMRIIKEGYSPANEPTQYLPAATVCFNAEAMARAGVEIPASLRASSVVFGQE